ncbi:MAG: ABC transporter substrate-binding protein [Candidatus Korarchaeum sp.]|nr:ABC transporter substrate-binding protein [Candidatus Korarchaeum sp.]MDW8035394.1 ABC transporter substrate-binding protein [Candidatus Korarchaeum sp.]
MSTKLVYVMILVALLIGTGLGYMLRGDGGATTVTTTVTKTVTPPAPAEAAGLKGEIYVGALLPLTGPLGSFAENDMVVLKLAEKDVNTWLEQVGAEWRVKVIFEDTALDPKQTLDKVQALHARGVKMFIGPMASSEVKEIKGYVDANKLLVISQSSTSPALAIAGDMIYRFCPPDEFQGAASAKATFDLGMRYVVAVWRGEAWGDGLVDSYEKAFAELLRSSGEKGEVLGKSNGKGIRYDPEAKEFTAIVSQLASIVGDLVKEYGQDRVGVFYAGFGEYVQFAAAASQYEILRKVKWIGSDGTALLGDIQTNENVAKFSYETKFISPMFGTLSPLQERIASEVKRQLGRLPESYAYAAYDALWQIAIALEIVDSYDPVAVAKVLPSLTQKWHGATGTFKLNENGDRAFSDYMFWMVVPSDGKYEWKVAASYSYEKGTITWSDDFMRLLGRG